MLSSTSELYLPSPRKDRWFLLIAYCKIDWMRDLFAEMAQQQLNLVDPMIVTLIGIY